MLFAWFCLGHDLHSLDGLSGSGVSSLGSRGVASEQALKRKKSANTSVCPGPRDGRDPSAVLDQDDRRLRSFGDAVTDPFYRSLRQGPRTSTPRRGTAWWQLRRSQHDLAHGAWSSASYHGPRWIQVCQRHSRWPSSSPALMGPLKPLPHHLPLFCLAGC